MAAGPARPQVPKDDVLVRGFKHPPQAARLRCYWWWLNGHTTKATITRDLEQMAAKGYGGALLVDANGANQEGNDMCRRALSSAVRRGQRSTCMP